MPKKPPIHYDCLRFSSILREALTDAGITDFVEIGKSVAQLQKYPPRKEIPYHPAVIAAWLDGSCLPPSAAFQALYSIITTRQTELVTVYKNAIKVASPATETSVLLTHRLKEKGMGIHALRHCLAEHGVRGRHSPMLHYWTVAGWCYGVEKIPDKTIDIVDQLLAPQEDTPILLATLQNVGAPSHSTYLNHAAEADTIQAALRNIRLALGMTYNQWSHAISTHLPEQKKVGISTVSTWEALPGRGVQSSLPSKHSFTNINPIAVFGMILKDRGFNAWFDEHRTHLERLLQDGIKSRQYRQQGTFSYTDSVPHARHKPQR